MAAKKQAGSRSAGSKAMGSHDDPRFIEVARGRSRRHELTAVPEANELWAPQARSWFNSLKLSGQSAFYEASDWATAICAAQAYDRFLRTDNAAILASFVRLTERLGCTVADRKRNRIELEDPDVEDADEDAADAAVQGWQARLRVLPGGQGLWQAGQARRPGSPEDASERARRRPERMPQPLLRQSLA